MSDNKFEIVFSVGNAAFNDEDGFLVPEEVEYVVEQAIVAMRNGASFARLRDSNGNRVGFYSLNSEGKAEMALD